MLAVLAGSPFADLQILLGRAGYGDPGLSALLGKFLYLDLMPSSFALVAAAMLLSIVAVQEAGRVGVRVAAGLALVAVATVYPLGVAGGLCFLFGLALADVAVHPDRWKGSAAWCGASLVAGAATVFAWGTGGGGEVFTVRSGAHLVSRGGFFLFAVAPWILLALPATVRALRERQAAMLGVVLACLPLFGAYLLFDVRQLEYKFVTWARLGLAVVVAASLPAWSPLVRRIAIGGAAVAIAALELVASMSVQPPASLAHAPPLVEDRFLLGVSEDSPHAEWLAALQATPADTILVARGLDFHASVFANRSLFHPVERRAALSAGYSLPSAGNMLRFRGYPPSEWKRRGEVVAALYETRDEAAFDEAVAALRGLGRPVVVRLPARDRQRNEWMRQRTRHVPLHSGPREVLWRLDPDGSGGAR